MNSSPYILLNIAVAGFCCSTTIADDGDSSLQLHQQLVVAAYNADVREVRDLLAAHADPNKRGNISPRLHNSPSRRKWDNGHDFGGGTDFNALLAVAASPGPDAPPAIYQRFAAQRILVARALIDADADLSITDREGRTALHLAIAKGNEEIAIFLLTRGIDPNQVSNEGVVANGEAPLHLAVRNEKLSERIVSKLLESGADVNIKSTAGETPLHLAVHQERPEIVMQLINHGANPFAKDNEGRIPRSRYNLSRPPQFLFPEDHVRIEIEKLLATARENWTKPKDESTEQNVDIHRKE